MCQLNFVSSPADSSFFLFTESQSANGLSMSSVLLAETTPTATWNSSYCSAPPSCHLPHRWSLVHISPCTVLVPSHLCSVIAAMFNSASWGGSWGTEVLKAGHKLLLLLAAFPLVLFLMYLMQYVYCMPSWTSGHIARCNQCSRAAVSTFKWSKGLQGSPKA